MPRPTPPTLEPYTSQLPDVNNAATWAERTPLFWNWVTGDGYINLTSLLSYSEDAIDFLDGVLAGSETLVDAVAAIQSQISGRNLIINGSGRINQRGYVSGTATTGANQFTLDRWFVVTSGQNLAFTGDASRRVMTAPAGGVRQVIEGSNIVGGDYVLNWDGTATATVGGVARTKGETFTLTANTNVTVTFASGTFTDVQLERGSVATPFEWRTVGQELALCQRFYQTVNSNIRFRAAGSGHDQSVPGPMFVQMRAVFTITVISSDGLVNATRFLTALGANGWRHSIQSSASGDSSDLNLFVALDAELTA